jgi:predicted DNA-binding transcriptional regulator|tara:strand:+ start:232 stop:471 length:240 start_codon:yes stop_codon:yes gene_type:complete
LAGILLYSWLLFFYNASITTLIVQITAFLGVAMILGIIAWIGYTIATTPPPELLNIGEAPETTISTEPTATEKPKTTKD